MKVKAGEGSIETRKVAFLVADGVSKSSVNAMKAALEKEGAKAVLISTKVGKMKYKEGGEEDIQFTYMTEASVCYDAFYTPSGDSVNVLLEEPDYFQFINEGYRHCKAIAFDKEAEKLVSHTYIKDDEGIIKASKTDLTSSFIKAMKGHRIWEREKARKVPV
jgi:catalase